MKNTSHLLFITFVLLSFSAFAQSNTTEQTILALSKKKFNWMIRKNLDSLSRALDERVKYVHSNGWTQTKQELLDDCRTGKTSYQKIEVSEASVRLYSNTAVLNGKGKFSGEANQTPFSIDLVYTEVYIKTSNQWLLVSRHASKLTQ